jgi:hypothetical protein
MDSSEGACDWINLDGRDIEQEWIFKSQESSQVQVMKLSFDCHNDFG